MPRGKDAPTRTGGQIDPYVQRSIQQSKQLSENRLVTAMQESGATGRAQIAAGATASRGDSSLAVAREQSASQAALADKQSAEDERARREDRKYTQTMTEASQKFQGKQAELEREFQIARQ